MENTRNLIETLFVILAVFIAVFAIISWLGGWMKLSRRYAFNGEPEGRRFRFQHVTFSRGFFPVGYNGCVTAWLGHGGVVIKVWPVFAIGHVPLRIPWEDISTVTESSWLGFRRYTMTISESGVTVTFNGKLGAAVRAYWESQSLRKTL